LIQYRPDARNKGGVIAAANLISWVGVGLAAAVYYLLAENMHFGADKIFFVGACMTLAATLYAVLLLPESVLRLCLWFLTNSLYHVRVIGRDNIPERGAALFLADDLSMIDAICLAASIDRPIRFFLTAQHSGRESFVERVMRMKYVGLVPAASGDGNNAFENLLAEAAPVLHGGEIACWAGAEARAGLSHESAAPEKLEELLASTGAAVVRVAVAGAGDGYLGGSDGRTSRASQRRWPCSVQVSFTAASVPRREMEALPRA
jgi:acyl-[acyl-carrier-protein]-phospholipid O-acyltransferase/long-chain-fatty-acid--[acyl-carrier-protein] ligase